MTPPPIPPKTPKSRSHPTQRYFPSRRQLGQSVETRAAEFLIARGLSVIERNFTCKVGEIDLIALEPARAGPELVFVEVRMRRAGFAWESAIESVGFEKLRRLERTIRFFLLQRERWIRECRVQSLRLDVLGFDGSTFAWFKAVEFPGSSGGRHV